MKKTKIDWHPFPEEKPGDNNWYFVKAKSIDHFYKRYSYLGWKKYKVVSWRELYDSEVTGICRKELGYKCNKHQCGQCVHSYKKSVNYFWAKLCCDLMPQYDNGVEEHGTCKNWAIKPTKEEP